jgi:hypothetical protein
MVHPVSAPRSIWTEGDAESFMKENRDDLTKWANLRHLLVEAHKKGFRAGQVHELERSIQSSKEKK